MPISNQIGGKSPIRCRREAVSMQKIILKLFGFEAVYGNVFCFAASIKGVANMFTNNSQEIRCGWKSMKAILKSRKEANVFKVAPGRPIINTRYNYFTNNRKKTDG